MSTLKKIHNLLDDNRFNNPDNNDSIKKDLVEIVNTALSNEENLLDKKKYIADNWYNKLIGNFYPILNKNKDLINILEKFISTIDLEDININKIFYLNYFNLLSEDNIIKLYNSLFKNKTVSNDKKIEIIIYFLDSFLDSIDLSHIDLVEKIIYDLIIRFPDIFDNYLVYTILKNIFILYCCKNKIDIDDKKYINSKKCTDNVYKTYYNLLNLFKNKKYEYSNENIAIYYHLSLYDKLDNNKKTDIDFFNFCYSNEYLNYILKICKNSYCILELFKNILFLPETIKKRNKISFNKNENENNKIIKKLEYFFNNKINPTKEMLMNIVNFFISIHEYNWNNSNNMVLNRQYIYDLTAVVNCFVYFGYKLTADDLCDLLENNCVITNFDDYEIDLNIEKYYNVVSKINCEPYGINIPYNIDNLREHCLNKTTSDEISKILEKNPKLKLDNICLQNLCLSSEYSVIKNIISKYNLKPDCICIYNAYKSDKSKICIKYLFMDAFSEEIKKYDNNSNNNIDNDESDISEKENIPIEIIPKKKVCKNK